MYIIYISTLNTIKMTQTITKNIDLLLSLLLKFSIELIKYTRRFPYLLTHNLCTYPVKMTLHFVEARTQHYHVQHLYLCCALYYVMKL